MAEAEIADPMTVPFIQVLVGRLRAEDSFGAWDRKPDRALLDDYIVTKEDRRHIPIIGDPDPDTLARVEKFYQAAGLLVERQTGLIASPMMKMNHEGFGRLILITGRLVVFAKSLRDVHRFGFESVEHLAEAGAKIAAEAIDIIAAHPDVAGV
jgi:probable nitrogen fixation protein